MTEVTPLAPTLLNRRARAATSSAIRDMLDRAKAPGMISFAGGIPDPERFPRELLARLVAPLMADHGRRTLQYGPTTGEPETRRALTTLYDPRPDGSVVDPDDLLVTSGAQQALDLVARVLFEPGQPVVCGQADYVGFLGVVQASGARPHPVAVDGDGLDVERLAADLRSGLRPRACYLVPHHHNPTGATITAERRAELHRLSSRYGFPVIEDDPYRALSFDHPPVEVDADPELSIRVRSVSKVLTPGLRIGAVTAPRAVLQAMATLKQSADLHTSSLTQSLVAAAIDTGFLDDHVAGLRLAYRAKRDRLLAALATELGGRAEVERPDGGMFAWLRVPGVDTGAWLDRAVEEGACFVPGQAFSVGTDLTEWARLSFVTASEPDLVEGVRRLVRALPARPGSGP